MRRILDRCSFFLLLVVCSGYLLILAFSLLNEFEPLQTWAAGYLYLSEKEIPSEVEVFVEGSPLLHTGSGAYYKGDLVGVYGRFGDFMPIIEQENGRYIVDDKFFERRLSWIGVFGLVAAGVFIVLLAWSLFNRRFLKSQSAG